MFINKTTIYVGLVLFLRMTSHSRAFGNTGLHVTSERVVLFPNGTQIAMVVLFPNQGSTIVVVVTHGLVSVHLSDSRGFVDTR
jgi:hypothetical protein